MLFNSYSFVLFFLAVILGVRILASWNARKLLLLVGSYFFYASWNPPFVVLLWLSTGVDWILAKRIDRSPSEWRRTVMLCMSLGLNLGLLGYFKYAGFVTASLQSILEPLGISIDWQTSGIVLPVGISFYTFQTLSYTIDVYRRKMAPARTILDFALYVAFFPQLVAGPIVRAASFIPQCEAERRATSTQFTWGLVLLIVGLFEKVVLADSFLAPVADRLFDLPADSRISLLTAWAGTLAFSGQIFCDFAGYSTSAIGVAMCLGFALPENFRMPYAARGFSDFWQRWHVSLSSWLRDYLYIPLGGNRSGTVRTYANLMITMLLGGLWHGASWTFVFWGGLHGTFLIGERLLNPWLSTQRWTRLTVARLAGSLLTFVLVCVTWVFFRARSFGQAFAIVSSMCGANGLDWGYSGSKLDLLLSLLTITGILVVHQLLRDTTFEQAANRVGRWSVIVAVVVMLSLLLVTRGDDRAFIYFQF